MVIGVISEDKNDCEAIGLIIKKILGNKTEIISAYGSGKADIIHQKKRLESKVFNFGCEVVFIVRDSDGANVGDITNAIESAYSTTRIRLRYKVCIAIEELEAWFLGDLGSVRSIYKLPVNSSRIPESNVDNIRDPKERLKEYIIKESKGKAQYLPSDTVRMANNLDIETARSRSNSFDYFYQTVVAIA
jgi:hypothetical protein